MACDSLGLRTGGCGSNNTGSSNSNDGSSGAFDYSAGDAMGNDVAVSGGSFEVVY